MTHELLYLILGVIIWSIAGLFAVRYYLHSPTIEMRTWCEILLMIFSGPIVWLAILIALVMSLFKA